MQTSMTLENLLLEVQRQTGVKRDFLASTGENVRMVPGYEGDAEQVYIVLRERGSELQRFSITEQAHRQIAGRLSIPWKYYQRLLSDHIDLVITQVNALFQREPAMRLMRVLDGKVRAFLSDRYRRLDNDQVLESALPAIVKGDIETFPLSMHVDDSNMHLKVLFTDESLSHEVATTGNGTPRIMKPGFRLSNSETGQGSLAIEAFFYDSYCTNGCVFGAKDAFSYQRHHLGGKLVEQEGFQITSDRTRRLEDETILSHVQDAIGALSDPDRVEAMADKLRQAHNSEKVRQPVAAVEHVVKQLDLRETEKDGILATFLRDADYSRYGMAAAITEQANNAETCTYSRACELEEIGSKILTMANSQWMQIVNAERVAA